MNSMERIFGAIRGEQTDCLPVAPYNGNFSIHTSGYTLDECYLDGKKLAEAQYRAWELVGQDVVVAQSDQYYMVEGMGVKTEYYHDRLPGVREVPVKELKDVGKLRPIDPYRDGRAYVYIEAVGHLAEKLKGEVPVRAPGCGSLAMAAHLMGINEFVMELAVTEAEEDTEKEKYIMEMMEVCTETLCRFAEACVKAGASIVQDADSLASLDMISPAIYEKYALPFEKKFFRRLNLLKKDYSFATLLHICGNNSRVAEKLADTGCDILEVDYKVDLSYYKEKIGDRVCLLGNINPAGNVMSGTAEDVREEAMTAIQKAAAGSRFILGSGCEIAVDAPLENVQALVKLGHGMPSSPAGRKQN